MYKKRLSEIIESSASKIARFYMDRYRNPGARLVIALVLFRAAEIIIEDSIDEAIESIEVKVNEIRSIIEGSQNEHIR